MEKDVSCLITFLITSIPLQGKNIYITNTKHKHVTYKENNAKEEFVNHPISGEIF